MEDLEREKGTKEPFGGKLKNIFERIKKERERWEKEKEGWKEARGRDIRKEENGDRERGVGREEGRGEEIVRRVE